MSAIQTWSLVSLIIGVTINVGWVILAHRPQSFIIHLHALPLNQWLPETATASGICLIALLPVQPNLAQSWMVYLIANLFFATPIIKYHTQNQR